MLGASSKTKLHCLIGWLKLINVSRTAQRLDYLGVDALVPYKSTIRKVFRWLMMPTGQLLII